MCPERDCLPSKQCQLYAGHALKEEAPTQVVPVGCVLSNGKTKPAVLAVCCEGCLPLLWASWRGWCSKRCWVQGSFVGLGIFLSREEILYALVSPGEGEQQMRGSSEKGEAAASQKCLLFFVVKVLPLNHPDSRYFSSVIFLSVSVLPAASQSKLTSTSVSPPLWQPLHLFFFVCLFVYSCWAFSPETSTWLWSPSSELNPPNLA